MSLVSSTVYNIAASQVLAQMKRLEKQSDRWERLAKWVDGVLRHDE